MIYHPYDSFYKSPFGAVAVGTTARFTIALPKNTLPPPGQVTLRLYRAGEAEPCDIIPMIPDFTPDAHNLWRCAYTPKAPALYQYQFDVGGWLLRRGDNEESVWTDPGETGPLWQLTVYDAEGLGTNFLPGGLIYQIFPDRFYSSRDTTSPPDPMPSGREWRADWGELPKYWPDADGEYRPNDFFGGDLQGVIQKLPYLAGLGVTCIYFNPIFEAHANHRYNTADYHKIDPFLGDEEDFSALCREAARYGIHIVLDGVFSHTGSDSVYFNREGRYGPGGAYRDPQSPYRSWYDFTDYPDGYACWWNFSTLPNVVETDPGYREFICGPDGVLAHWLRAGASGYRLDVADELPDPFLDALRARVKAENPQAAIIGEVWEDASHKASYGSLRRYLLGAQLDSVTNYPFLQAVLRFVRHGDAFAFYRQVMAILDHYPPPVVASLVNSLSTHDSVRAITALAGAPLEGNDRLWQGEKHSLPPEDYELGKRLLRLASLLQYTLPGVPCLYYGDEAGLVGYKDPFNRCCYPWGHEDEALLAHFTLLGRLRKDTPLLADAPFHPLAFAGDLVCFARVGREGCLYTVVNRGEYAVTLPPALLPDAVPAILVGEWEGGVLGPRSGMIIIQ